MQESAERIAFLRNLQKEDPEDPFLHYAICLELKKTNHPETHPSFEKLLNKFPEYLPAYYQMALFLAEAGQANHAISTISKGIDLAVRQNELHALSELKGLKQNILTGEFD